MQTLQELETGELEIPIIDGKVIDSKELARDIKVKVIDQFRRKGVDINIGENKYHRAFFAHCTKRILDSLKDGEFVGDDGFVGKKPEIADTIINRVNEIVVQKTLGV